MGKVQVDEIVLFEMDKEIKMPKSLWILKGTTKGWICALGACALLPICPPTCPLTCISPLSPVDW